MHELGLAASSTSIPVARELTARAGRAAGLDAESVELARLAVSEVVTNALVHGRPPVHLRIDVDRDSLRVGVGDASDVGPQRRRPGRTDPRGRGLAIVDRIADRWGCDRQPGGGKVVWFEIDR